MKRALRFRPTPLRAFLRLILCLAIFLLLEGTARAEIVVRDDLGHTIRLERPATRIIALYGAFNEILAAMGLEHVIVARTNTDRIPPSILDKPSIGTHMRPNVELVYGHKPDLVLQMDGRKQASETVNALKRIGVTTAYFKAVNFEELFSIVERIGILTGAETASLDLILSMKTRLDKVKTALKDAETNPRVFFEVRYPNLLGAGRGSIVNDILRRAGGVNCIESRKKLVRIGEEKLLQLGPDAYIVQQGAMNQKPMALEKRPHYRILKAVRNQRILFVDEQVFSRPGPRNVDAVEALAEFLHPQLIFPSSGSE